MNGTVKLNFDPLDDGISSVGYVDHMGDDLTVVNAARVSMAKESEWTSEQHWDGIQQKVMSEGDVKLIRYLAKHGHWTPFSQPQIQLRIKMPIFVARQWFKHQIGFTRNEVSRRYVDDTPELFFPKEWRERAENVKQGSKDGVHPQNDLIKQKSLELAKLQIEHYEWLISIGTAPEQARMELPQKMYTEFIETASLAAYARLAGLRLDPHAQLEVRRYAGSACGIVEKLYPYSWKELMAANGVR